MAVLAFDRLRMLWGGFDWQHGSGSPYTPAQTATGGASAAPGTGNIGVRRAVMVLDRSAMTPGDDDINFHFDWLNITAGAPDDTWTTADYSTLETQMQTFWTSYKVQVASTIKLREIRWYRHGPGVGKPNPAERVFTLGTPVAGTASSPYMSAQVACTITFRTAVRRSWGRTYLPFSRALSSSSLRLQSVDVDAIAAWAQTLVNSAAASDFRLVVTSNALSAALNVEKVEVDDILDVVRRRRLKHTGYKAILP